MSFHQNCMKRCLELALNGRGYVNPNPLVGCVIVKNQSIISEGWHKAFGQYHAEKMAIETISNQDDLKGADLYVNLEPCSHFGKTPPCADLIISSGIKRVFIGMMDPNPLVCGNGISKLKSAGIEVHTGILEKECAEVNRFFITQMTKKRPYVILKWAQTSNNFLAPIPKDKIQISGEKSMHFVHRLRRDVSAILIGVNTWMIDKPLLNNRLVSGPSPIRLVIDPNLRGNYLEPDNELQPVWVLNSKLDKNEFEGKVVFIQFDFQNKNLLDLLKGLSLKGINSILVEGGARTLQSFIDENLVDEMHIMVNTNMEFQQGLMAPILNLDSMEFSMLGNDKHYYKMYEH